MEDDIVPWELLCLQVWQPAPRISIGYLWVQTNKYQRLDMEGFIYWYKIDENLKREILIILIIIFFKKIEWKHDLFRLSVHEVMIWGGYKRKKFMREVGSFLPKRSFVLKDVQER